MRLQTMALQSLMAVAANGAAQQDGSRAFRPQSGGLTSEVSSIPTPYNLSVSQTNQDPSSSNGSFWMSSFIHGSNGHDYLAVSQAIVGLFDFSVYRATLLDITDPSKYTQFMLASNISDGYSSTGVFNASFPNYGFGSTSPTDPILEMRTFNTLPGTTFDLTFELSSPAILNGGCGAFYVGGDLGFQWSMPAGRTSGSITVGGRKVHVDPERSLTWYDRQWGSLPVGNFSWFQVHLPGRNANESNDDDILSIWTWHDVVNGDKAFATTRRGASGGQVVTPVTWTASGRAFTSPVTGLVWNLEWTVNVHDGPVLQLSSIRDDQEARGAGIPVKAYTGFLNVSARYPDGQRALGYGLVESFML